MIYTWKCTACGSTEEVTRMMADCKVPPADEQPCDCGENLWTRVFESPMIMKASYPDGYKRKGWTELKESAKLEKEAAVAKDSTKAEIKREIRKMGIKPGSNS